MANNDLLDFAVGSFFLMIFITGILTLATGGTALILTDAGETTYNHFAETITLRAIQITPNSPLDNMIDQSANPMAFDIILAMINVGAFLLQLITLVGAILINYLTLSVWLMTAGVTGAIAGLVVMIWQIMTLRVILAFVFKDRIRPN